jgi:hypothetical protein
VRLSQNRPSPPWPDGNLHTASGPQVRSLSIVTVKKQEGPMSVVSMKSTGPATLPSLAPKPRQKKGAAQWVVALLLVLVSAIPIAVGIYILFELAAGNVRPETARHLASPAPVVLHIVAAAVYAIFGAFQFTAAFRRRFPGWHKGAGRVLLVCGLVAGLSGLWITLFYPRLPDTNDLLFVIRVVFSSALVAFIVLGFVAIRHRDIPHHRAWMMRAYAIGLGVGTQAVVFMVAEVIAGPPDQLAKALLMGAAWVINLVVAELVIQRGTRGRPVSSESTSRAASERK